MRDSAVLQLLHSGSLRAGVAPHIGGALTSFYSLGTPGGEPRHWLRSASAEALANGDPFDMASFPLVPWANRIRDGQFRFDGRTVQLPPNRGGDPHTIHGIGWMQPWDVCERSNAHIVLRMTCDGKGHWPYAFSAQQRYTLDASGLHIAIAVTNQGTHAMPAGLGHHPYLPHDVSGHGTRLTAKVAGMWESDGAMLPVRLTQESAATTALRQGMVLRDFDLDNNFTGFGGLAQVTWPNGDQLHMRSQAPLDYFVLYCPQHADIFCIEPVSNCTDWLNLRTPLEHAQGQGAVQRLAGGHVLLPGQTLHGALRLDPVLAAPTEPA